MQSIHDIIDTWSIADHSVVLMTTTNRHTHLKHNTWGHLTLTCTSCCHDDQGPPSCGRGLTGRAWWKAPPWSLPDRWRHCWCSAPAAAPLGGVHSPWRRHSPLPRPHYRQWIPASSHHSNVPQNINTNRSPADSSQYQPPRLLVSMVTTEREVMSGTPTSGPHIHSRCLYWSLSFLLQEMMTMMI